MTVGPETAFPVILLSADAVIVIVCLIVGRPLKDLCTVVLWCNVVAFVLSLIPLVFILDAMRISSEAGLALGFALMLPTPFLAATLLLMATRRWRMRPPKNAAE
jgi:hypothetical protein